MPVPNPTMPVKGAGTTLWVYKGSGDPYANPLSDVDWSRLAKVKDLTPGELTAESYDDSYLDDEDADWTATGQGQKSAGEGNTNISGVTVVFRAGEQEQTPPEGFESSGSEAVLGTEVKYDTPITFCP